MGKQYGCDFFIHRMDAAEVFDYWHEDSHIQKRYKLQHQLFEALTMLYCRLDGYCKFV